jgi:N-acetylneuraminate synthase
MNRDLSIAGRLVGRGRLAYIIADPAANHQGRYEVMEQLLHAAVEAGADAFKTQTYRPEDLTIDCSKDPFRLKGTLWDGRTLWQLYKEAAIPWEWNERLQKVAREEGIDLFSTAYSLDAVDYLANIGVPVIKVASFEMNNDLFLRQAAKAGLPLLVSTGMSSMEEMRHAHRVLEDAGAAFALLHCISAYPALSRELHLRRIKLMLEEFPQPVGFSDHSLSPLSPALAVGVGASIIEKHIRLDGQKALDSGFSLEGSEFRKCVDMIRQAEDALGFEDAEQLGKKLDVSSELLQLRRSLFVVKDVEFGDRASPENVRAIRPSGGLAPKMFDRVLGRRFMRDVERGSPLKAEDIEWADAEL